MSERRCDKCEWWSNPHEDEHLKRVKGSCRKGLPVIVPAGDCTMDWASWPLTDPAGWCSEFKAKATEPPD